MERHLEGREANQLNLVRMTHWYFTLKNGTLEDIPILASAATKDDRIEAMGFLWKSDHDEKQEHLKGFISFDMPEGSIQKELHKVREWFMKAGEWGSADIELFIAQGVTEAEERHLLAVNLKAMDLLYH